MVGSTQKSCIVYVRACVEQNYPPHCGQTPVVLTAFPIELWEDTACAMSLPIWVQKWLRMVRLGESWTTKLSSFTAGSVCVHVLKK